ncbi:MAG: NusG domain II-containing protein [Oscillospiraceae bacterium]|nr:NusG domain II-containing protein [Oscillospiraceae bacterium]
MSGAAKRKPVFDLILIGGLLLLALVCYLLFAGSKSDGNVAVVCVNGVETERYPLYQNGRYPLNGGSNILIIENGVAWLEDADCPDKLCVRQGKVHLDGQVITCLPNKLTVTIRADNSEVELIS